MKDITQDPEALNDLINKGFNVTPVIFIGDQFVVGFNRAEIDALLQE